MEHLTVLRELRETLQFLQTLLDVLPTHSLLWTQLRALRQRTLEHYFDLSPDVRCRFKIDPKSVICVF